MSPGELHMEAVRNNSCVITIVGYHGNSVYRVVASIPVWVTCGRFSWKAPTRIYISVRISFVLGESSATLTTDRLHCKLQTRPLVREGAQGEEKSNFPTKDRKK
jgi:hypothetical protein